MSTISPILTLPEAAPHLIKAKEIAKLVGCGVRTVWKWHSKGIMPAPAERPGTSWVRSEIEEWIADGCPDLTGDRLRYRRRRKYK